MEQIMEFWRLKSIILYALIAGCTSDTQQAYHFIGYHLGSNRAFDSIDIIELRDNTYEVRSNLEGSLGSYELTEVGNHILYQTQGCEDTTQIALEVGSVFDNKCPSTYPIIGERMTVIDSKSFKISDSDYRVFKIFNEIGNSNLNSSTIFWTENYGIILILLTEGRYFELFNTNNDRYPWKTIVSEVKDDSIFSTLTRIPPTPPPPEL